VGIAGAVGSTYSTSTLGMDLGTQTWATRRRRLAPALLPLGRKSNSNGGETLATCRARLVWALTLISMARNRWDTRSRRNN